MGCVEASHCPLLRNCAFPQPSLINEDVAFPFRTGSFKARGDQGGPSLWSVSGSAQVELSQIYSRVHGPG